MSKKAKSKAASTRKALIAVCAVLVVILIGSLAALGLLIYNENTKNAKTYRPSVAATCMLLGGMFIFQTVASLSN